MTKPAPLHLRPSVEELRSLLDYDPLTGIFTHIKSGGRKKAGSIAGSVLKGYICIGVQKHTYFAHHLAWFLTYQKWPAMIDHRDLNGQNNAIENLRQATIQQNAANKRVSATSKTGIKCVSVNRHGRFRVRIRVNGVKKSFGSYVTPEEASEVYRKVAVELHGEFARI